MSTLYLKIETQRLLPFRFEVSVGGGGGGGGDHGLVLSPWREEPYGASVLEGRTLMKVSAVLKGGCRSTCLGGD